MRTAAALLAIEMSLCWTLMGPAALLSQSPGFNWGRLAINSNPTGASIFINSQQRGQTPATFVVNPGDYTVSVSGSANCGGQKFHVNAGGTTTILCKDSNWSQQ